MGQKCQNFNSLGLFLTLFCMCVRVRLCLYVVPKSWTKEVSVSVQKAGGLASSPAVTHPPAPTLDVSVTNLRRFYHTLPLACFWSFFPHPPDPPTHKNQHWIFLSPILDDFIHTLAWFQPFFLHPFLILLSAPTCLWTHPPTCTNTRYFWHQS